VASECAIGPEKRHQDERGASDDEPGIDLLTLDDVAALERFVEPLAGRIFGTFGIVVSSGHDCLPMRCQ
jgi:hypothetical protein